MAVRSFPQKILPHLLCDRHKMFFVRHLLQHPIIRPGQKTQFRQIRRDQIRLPRKLFHTHKQFGGED